MVERSWRCLVGCGLTALVGVDGAFRPAATWDEVGNRTGWLVLEAGGDGAADWVALDFDNPGGAPEVGAEAQALAARVLQHAAQGGHRGFWWPSKSRRRHPRGGAGHAFFWLPGWDPPRQRERVMQWLEGALGTPATHVAPEARRALGLNPALHVFFPPDTSDEPGLTVRLSVAATADLPAFRTVWEWFCGSA